MATSGFIDHSKVVGNSINIIAVWNNDILFCKTLDNNVLKLRNIEELELYLKDDSDLLNRNLYVDTIELEEEYLIRIIPKYSKMFNKGYIDWLYRYSDISFMRLRKLRYDLPISLIVNVHPGEMGAAGGMGLISIKGVLSIVFNGLKYIFTEWLIRKFTYKFFLDNYSVSKEFIHKVIKEEWEWNKHFIDSNSYPNKWKYEKKIMKDCGYKFDKKNKIWKRKY